MIQKLIDEVMDCFDFERVHKAMVALDWTWHDVDGVPDVYEIKKHARALLKDAIKRNVILSTGGFRVGFDPDEEVLFLEFIVDSWEAYK